MFCKQHCDIAITYNAKQTHFFINSDLLQPRSNVFVHKSLHLYFDENLIFLIFKRSPEPKS